MKNEIERKFLVKEIPNLSGIIPVSYERYYLRKDANIEERIQKKGNKFYYEKKERLSPLERTSEKKEISEKEFELLKKEAGAAIIRDSYRLSASPNLSLKVYKNKYEGLVRAEVEFDSRESAEAFRPTEWMDKEITESVLGQDSKLSDLSREAFLDELKRFAN